jgi:hypothetical protein
VDLLIDKRHDEWTWIGSRTGHGYGTITFGGATRAAHRFVYEIYVGPIPDGLHIMHLCHQGAQGCVTPEHMAVGTPAENLRMKAENHRQGRGHNRKLTPEIVRQMRRKYEAGGVYAKDLAVDAGVSLPTVYLMLRRKTWKSVI